MQVRTGEFAPLVLRRRWQAGREAVRGTKETREKGASRATTTFKNARHSARRQRDLIAAVVGCELRPPPPPLSLLISPTSPRLRVETGRRGAELLLAEAAGELFSAL